MHAAAAPGRLVPSEEARLLAEHMAGATDVHRTILEETIESGERGQLRESGRTACSSVNDIRGPIQRFPRAVLLEECPPVQAAGIWHTHPAGGELRSPRHSLPDWANVVFGAYDVSIVTGTRSMQVLTAAADPEAMHAAFQDVLGVEATTKADLVDALVAGRIPDHTTAVQQVEARLSPLVQRRPLSFPDLEARMGAGAPTAPGAGGQTASQGCAAYQQAISPDAAGLRRQAREAGDAASMVTRRIAAEGFNEAIGIVAGTIVSRWLFNG